MIKELSFRLLGSPEVDVLWGYACPSVRTSICTVFLGICSLVFSEILHSDRNLETEKKWKKWIFQKNYFYLEMGKKGPKRAQSGVLLGFPKYLLLFFARRNLKWKTLKFAFYPCKPHIWENSVSQAEKLSSNQIVEFLDHQNLWK